MNSTQKVIYTLLAGATLGLASPVFADSDYDHGRREHFREYDRHAYYGYDRYARRPVIVERPYVVERPYYVGRPVIVEQPVYYNPPVYYSQPVQSNLGVGAMVGAAIGTIFDNRQYQ